MNNYFKSNWLILTILFLFSIFVYWGIQFVPFHPDESTQLYMSGDFETLFSKPSDLYWRAENEEDPQQRYRELDAPLTKYIIGIGRIFTDQEALPKDWDWGLSWDENINYGRFPDKILLTTGRVSITTLLPISLILIFLIGQRLNGKWTGLFAVILLGTNAVVLLHCRRSMAEGTLLFGVLLAVYSILHVDKFPWFTGLSFAIAFNSKQSALALLPIAIFALMWRIDNTKLQVKKIIINLLIFSSVFILTTFLLNPLYWRTPIKAAVVSYNNRMALVELQVSDTKNIAPEKVLDTPLKRVLSMITNLYISPPEYGLVGNLVQTRETVDKYIDIPGHNLFRGLTFGAIFLTMTLFGLILAMRRTLRGNYNDNRTVILVLLATALMGTAILGAVPLSWIRYTVPMIPFVCIWIAYGITTVFTRKEGKKDNLSQVD